MLKQGFVEVSENEDRLAKLEKVLAGQGALVGVQIHHQVP